MTLSGSLLAKGNEFRAIKRSISFETVHYHETKSVWYIMAFTYSSVTVYVSEMPRVKKDGLQPSSLGKLIKIISHFHCSA